jgi:sec-independent protein translocase protein TatB
MFDISFPELMLVAIVGLVVIGPDRLPEMLRTLGLWFGRMRRSFMSVKNEIEREIGMDDVRRQLHNEAVMEEMKRIEAEVKRSVKDPAILPPKPRAVDDPGANVSPPPADQQPDDNATPPPAERQARDG